MSCFTNFGRVKRMHIMSQRGRNFLQAPWAGGIVLVVCVVIAMLLANLPATASLYHKLLHMELGLSIGGELFPEKMSVEKFVNDALMVVFFFTVGLEIRREMSHGELSTPKKAILPIIAALGGMLMPAAIYTCLNYGTEAIGGWGIPTATDIAFAIGIMSLLGNRVPISLKVFLTALAVADDLGAIIVIALFYGETPNLLLLGVALASLELLHILFPPLLFGFCSTIRAFMQQFRALLWLCLSQQRLVTATRTISTRLILLRRVFVMPIRLRIEILLRRSVCTTYVV